MERNTFPDIPGEIRLSDDGFHQLLAAQPVVVDMGCGHGDFLIEFAPRNPSYLFIGVEISRKRAHKTAIRLAKRDVANFRVIAESGEFALKILFPSGSVDELHINFPEPWLRTRYWKTRILKPSFLIQIIRVLKPGGDLHFVSDIAEYAEYAYSLFSRFPQLTNCYDEPVKKNLVPHFPTLFYRKMSPLRDINYVRFKKVSP